MSEKPSWWARFLSKCVRIPKDPDQEVGCLMWVGGQSRGGQRASNTVYGSFSICAGLKGVRAHVVAATEAGIIRDYRVPRGMHLDHECNRSLCVEETHLKLIPSLDNVRLRHTRPARPLSEEQRDYIRLRGIIPLGLAREEEDGTVVDCGAGQRRAGSSVWPVEVQGPGMYEGPRKAGSGR